MARGGVALAAASRLSDLAAGLGGELDPQLSSRSVDRVVAPEDAERDGELAVVSSARAASALACGTSTVLLCSPELAARLPHGRRWIHPHPMWVLARVLGSEPPAASLPPVSRDGAWVDPRASIAPDVRLEPGVVVLGDARVGSGSIIGANSVVYGGVILGSNVGVGALSVIGRAGFGWVRGPADQLVRMPHLAGVQIEDDVEIGALCTVDAGVLRPTRIGRGTKLDAHVHVGHNCEVGEDVFVAAQAGFAGSVRIEAGVLVGGQAGVTDHARLGAGARIAAKSGVVGDIPAGAVVAGFPAVARMRWLRAMAALLKVPSDR